MKKEYSKTHITEIKQQAAAWVAKLYSGQASQSDEETLQKWLTAEAIHASEYNYAMTAWDIAAANEDDCCTAGENQDENYVDITTERRASRFLIKYVATGIAASFILFFVSFMMPQSPTGETQFIQTFATVVGESKTVGLQDGSSVTLNTNSRLYVDFSTSMRRAILDSGEAYFEVTKDPTRPFVVTAGLKSVTVLGTKFNVHRDGSKLTVAVVEGTVIVHDNIVPELLEANARKLIETPNDPLMGDFQHYKLEAGSVGTFVKGADLFTNIEQTNTRSYQVWRGGIVKFNDSPLALVVEELNRYAPKKIQIVDAEIAELKISGVFHFDDMDGILTGLDMMLPVAITETSDMFLIAAISSDD